MEHEERLEAALADRYQIEREIGSGGMATVYLAQDLKHNRRVAVKVLNPDLAQTLGAERFLREIETAANLTHPHILPLFDSGEADGFLFYVMPYVKGESLRARLAREKQLPVEDAVQITREIADALAYAHEEGVIHRDVKPANIMLEAGHAVLADFGVAHAVAEAKDERLTRTGTSLGTPAYMSPEQATGEQDLDGRSDQYALGCVLYEMLAGHPPFAGAQVEALVRQHLTEEPPSVTGARPSAPGEVAKVIERALAKSPADRFRTTGEMAAALSLTTSPSRQEPKGSVRHKKIGLAAAAVILGISVWALLRGPPEAASPPASPEPESVAEALNQLPSIAVLPFANRSGIPDDQYFTDGIQDELLTHLQRVPGLRVISRTSSETYRGTQKTILEIGRELNVGYVLEGGVQRASNQVRIHVQLVDARNEGHLWAETYDRVLTPENLFEVQTEIVRNVAGELNIALRTEEWMKRARLSTSDPDAYDLYLRAINLSGEGRTEEALGVFEEAVEQDPEFVAAYAQISVLHSTLYQYRGQRSEEGAAVARWAADKAVELAPESEWAQFAMGLYLYRVEKSYERALDWLGRASGTLTGDAAYHYYRAITERRMGRWNDAVASHQSSLSLSPRNATYWREAGLTYLYLRRWAEAEEALRMSQSLNPGQATSTYYLSRLVWFRDGSTEEARSLIEPTPPRFAVWELAMMDRRLEDAVTCLEALPEVSTDQYTANPKALLEAETLAAFDNHEAAREKYEKAVTVLDSMVVALPNDERSHAALALAYAGLGNREMALAEARRAIDIMPRDRDAVGGNFFLFNLAAVHAQLGEVDEALEVLESLLSAPSRFPPNMLEDHFLLRPIHDDPRFRALMDRERERVF